MVCDALQDRTVTFPVDSGQFGMRCRVLLLHVADKLGLVPPIVPSDPAVTRVAVHTANKACLMHWGEWG